MLDTLRYRYRRFRLNREIRRELRDASENPAQELRKAIEHKRSREETDELWEKVDKIAQRNHDRLALLETDHLISMAEERFLPTPQLSYRSPGIEWRLSESFTRFYLTQEAMRELRVAIRADQREKAEIARTWLGSLTGFIGALIGLAAVILRKG